ncbi:MAG: hypothetical protein ACOCOY_06110 [Prevotella sp.]
MHPCGAILHHLIYVATGDVRWRHSEGKMRDFTTLDAFDYHYGLMAR